MSNKQDQYTENYEVNTVDFEVMEVTGKGHPAAEEDDEDCIILSDDDSQEIVDEQIIDNGDVASKEVTDDTTVKIDEEDESEDDLEDEQAEEERAKVEPGFFADELELLELTLPQQTLIKDRALKLWNSRKLIVYPVPEEELEKPQMKELLKDPNCSQVTIHLEREKVGSEDRIGLLDLVFDSKERAVQAVEQLKGISSKFNILNAADVAEWNKQFDDSRSVHFSAYESKKWPSCLVCVKYLPHNITEEKLREIFPDAFEVMIYQNDRPNLTETQRFTAFLFYGAPEEAKAVVQTNNDNKRSFDGVRLAFFKYDQITHPQLISPSLLAMSERYIILKEKRIVERLAKIRGGHCATVLEKFNTKLKEDETVRKTYCLPTPTVDEMRTISNLKILKGAEAFKVIKQRGLLWRNRDKLLSTSLAALEPPVHPENKGLRSGVTNPNKRKRRKMAIETKTTSGAPRPVGPPSLLQTVAQPVPRPPVHKLMRLASGPDFTSYGEDESYETEETEYPEMMYPAEPNVFAPPLRRFRPQMVRPPRVRPPMPRGVAPRVSMTRLMATCPPLMVARPAPMGAGRGYPPRPRMENPVGSRLLRLAHGGPVSSSSGIVTSASMSSTPRHLMAQMPRPRLPAFGGLASSASMRRPVMMGHCFPGPGVLIRRTPRPLGRAGWAVRN